MEFFQEASGNIMKILKKSINIISWWDMRRKTGSMIGWLGWSDSLIAEATGCHWWSTESEEWWQDLLFYVHSSPTVSLFHSMCSYSIFMYFCWTRMRWTVINDQHVEDIHWHRTSSICNTAVYSSKKGASARTSHESGLYKSEGVWNLQADVSAFSCCTILWAQEQCNGTLAAADSFSRAHWHQVHAWSSRYW